MICEIRDAETAYLFASHLIDPSCGPWPFDLGGDPGPRGMYSARIDATVSSVRSDLFALLPIEPRPLAHISSVLSWGVPRKRWSGRTQIRLSQRCKTHNLSGIVPKCSSHEKRCACIGALPEMHILPYPRIGLRFHVQHPSDLLTFDQKSSIISRLCLPIVIIYSTYTLFSRWVSLCH